MNRRRVFSLFLLAGVSFLLLACSRSSPDLVATEVAVQQAAAATLTAQAPILAVTPTPAALEVTPTPQVTEATQALSTPNLTPPPPAAVETPAAPTPPDPSLCTVVSAGLRLRAGPGTVYEPPLGTVAAGTELEPLAFSPTGYPAGSWLQVMVKGSGQVGWVSAEPQFVNCTIDPAGLPLAPAPPTPTSTPAPVAIAPTPTRPLLAVVPVDGGQSDLEGQIVLPGYDQTEVSDPMVFRDKLVFHVEVYNPAVGTTNGAGIRNVKFTIAQEDDGQEVYERTEQSPAYCVFSGGEPDCNVLVFAQAGYEWPESGEPIRSGPHRAFILITTQNGETEQWNWGFQIERPEIKLALAQIGPGSTSDEVGEALVFQVEAYDSGQGEQDGRGIARVDLMILIESDGRVVYERTEQTARYCAFGGGEPQCTVWDFGEHGNRWPSGEPVENGTYTLRAIAYGEDGRGETLEINGVKINLE